jgi:hypothetical protein
MEFGIFCTGDLTADDASGPPPAERDRNHAVARHREPSLPGRCLGTARQVAQEERKP